MLTAERLHELLKYNKRSGVFVWRTDRQQMLAGDTAGSIDYHGYRLIRIDGVKYKASRLAFLYVNGRWPNQQVDHKNRIRDDDRWSNLREASHAQNMMNRPSWGKNGKGIVSVRDRYKAQINLNGKQKYLGSFKTKTAAADAYKVAARKYFGSFSIGGKS